MKLRSRLALPKRMRGDSKRAVVIPVGSFLVVIPLPPKPSVHAKELV